MPRERLCVGVFVDVRFEFLLVQRVPFVVGVATEKLADPFPEVLVGERIESASAEVSKGRQFRTWDTQLHHEANGHRVGKADALVGRKKNHSG